MDNALAFDVFYSSAPGISVSTLDTFSRCPRRYFYRFGVGIGKEEHIALLFGQAIHAALPDAFFNRVVEAKQRFVSIWGSTEGDDKRNTLNGFEIIDDYAMSHINGRAIYNLSLPPTGVIVVDDKVSDYEIPFVLDIGLPVPLVGRVDCLGTHRDTKEPWVIEWKTSSEMSTRFFDGFQFSPQVVAYTLALRSYGVPVKGVIVEGLKVSAAKKDAHGTLSNPIFVSDEMINAFLEWARWSYSLIAMSEQRKSFVRDLSACTPYPQHGSPGYSCEYLPMCLMSDWTKLKDLYVKADYPTFRMLKLDQLKEVAP